jgi:hypothetical protein
MEFLKNIFSDKALTFADFKAAIEADRNIKLVNLADGKYVDKDKLDKKSNELTEAQNTITKLNGEIETLKTNGADVEKLKQTIADYEAKEQKRADDEKAFKETEALKARFSPLKGDKKFLNEGTEQWIFGEFEKALSLEENKGKGDAEIFEAITKNKNIYENPNTKFVNPPVGNQGGKDNQRTTTLMKAMGLKEKEND